MTELSHQIRMLNGLIASTFDSIDGFAVAAENAKDDHLSEIFSTHANQRAAVVRSFQAEVSRLGGKPEERGTFLAGLPRNFLKLKAAVIRNDLRAILGEVEREEERLEARFKSALADDALLLSVKAVIRAGFASVREGYHQMRDTEHGLAIAA